MQKTLLRERSQNIDIQIRKHQTRLHNIELKRLQHGSDEKALQEMVNDKVCKYVANFDNLKFHFL
jgi:hypothetical protein